MQPMDAGGKAMWKKCLASAFRTAVACTIVGGVTFYGPESITRQVAFPAFSYVTVILIITDAALGDTLRGCWLALYATCQSVGPALLSLWLIGPARLTAGTTALAVGLAGFVVVLPNQTTHLVAKRIALGQIVITYVIAYINGEKTDALMHPLRVAASTALGVAACVLALVLPYPRLASSEVKQSCKALADNTTERLKLYVKSICAEDNTAAVAGVSKAKLLTRSASKLHETVKRYQPSMTWERNPFKLWRKEQDANAGKKLQDMETALRGMEMALAEIQSYPVGLLETEVKESVLNLEKKICVTIKQAKNSLQRSDSLSVNPESDSENATKFFQTLQQVPATLQDLPPFFFLFCMSLLQIKSSTEPIRKSDKTSESSDFSFKGLNWESCWEIVRSRTRKLMPAMKLSLSLGLAVFFGSMYSRENGYWSGLPVAISLAASREATFKIANVKAQGTVLGTVYGVMGCFVFERFLSVRFLSLIPWFIFSSFLSQSVMYGQAGGISAVIGAVLILGRKNFGPPSEFAIARITETFIGLSCSIVVELLLQPSRASTLAKVELAKCFGALHQCVSSFDVGKTDLIENQTKLKTHLTELKKFVKEAEIEPNFWFLPFNSSYYNKLIGSLSRTADLVHFAANAIGFLAEQESIEAIDVNIKAAKEMVGSLIKSFERIILLKSLKALDKALEKDHINWDLEVGKPSQPNFFGVLGSNDENRVEKILGSYLQNSREITDKDNGIEDEKELRIDVVLSLSALGYCMKVMMNETKEIEKTMKEIVQWENPMSHIDLHEISCKIQALYQ